MIPAKSLKVFHRILNFVILSLAIIVFILMIRLIKNEYFTNKNNDVENGNNSVNNSNAVNGNNSNAVNGNNSNAVNGNNSNAVNGNNSNISLEKVGKKVLNLIIPDNLNITTSDINNMTTTPATIQNGNVVIQSTTPATTSTTSTEQKENQNNTIFTTQTKINKDSAPDLTTPASMNGIDYEYQSMFNKVRNFLKYPDEQKFCPNIDNSESSFWVHLPEKYAGDHLCKFCCTSCYTLVSKEIYCGENSHGLYILDNFSVNDLAKLRELYDSTPELSEDFKFPEIKLNSLLGKAVLKIRYDEDYHTIQVIKTSAELMEHEVNPAISHEIYVDSYKCPAVATKPVLQIVNV